MAKVTNITAKAPAAPAVDEHVIEAAAKETASMGRVDRVFHWDKRQAGPDAIVCGHDKSHGRLVMHGSGSVLMCGASKGGAPCTFTQPVSV